MGAFNEIINKTLGKHPLVKISSTIEFIEPYGKTALVMEGLIKTYPIDDVIKTLSRIFDLKAIDQTDLRKVYLEIKSGIEVKCNGFICKNTINSDVLEFIVGGGDYNKEVLDSYLNKYGYFLSNQAKWDTEWIRYQYEKKFDIDITDLVKDRKYIYHICPNYLENKILKQGITPHKGKFAGYSNDYRCYFFVEDLRIFKFSQWANDFKTKNKINTDAYLLIKIDTSKIKQDIKFYVDPRMDSAAYTLQGIGPEAFTEINIIKV